jgi:hypothetical protein
MEDDRRRGVLPRPCEDLARASISILCGDLHSVAILLMGLGILQKEKTTGSSRP